MRRSPCRCFRETLPADNADLQIDLKAASDNPLYEIVELKRADEQIYLLGETHIKTETASQLGKNLIRHFPLVGIEKIELSDYPWIIRIMLTPVFFVPYEIPWPFTRPSTIKTLKKDPNIGTFDLEAGHVPGWQEYLALLFIFYSAVLLIALFCGLMGTPSLRAILAVLSIPVIFEASLLSTDSSFFVSGLMTRRDKTMAHNLLQNSCPESPLLAIMGRPHLKGVTKYLNEAGFSGMFLDE